MQGVEEIPRRGKTKMAQLSREAATIKMPKRLCESYKYVCLASCRKVLPKLTTSV